MMIAALYSCTMHDITVALRRLKAAPLFALVTILVLGVGVGAVASMFSLVNALFLRPLPIEAADRLVSVQVRTADGTAGGLSLDELRAMAVGGDAVVEAVFAGRDHVFNTGVDAGAPLSVLGLFITEGWFRGLGVSPAMGRVPDAGEAGVVVSHAYWRRWLGGTDAALGRPIVINGRPIPVTGVAPAGFTGTFVGVPFDLFVPVSLRPSMLSGEDDRTEPFLEAYAVLRPGATPAGAAALLARAAAESFRARPAGSPVVEVNVRRATGLDPELERPARLFVAVLLSIALGILLLACANVGNMFLARAQQRSRELAVRYAIGASRGGVVRLMVTESLLLFLMAGAVGVALSLLFPVLLERLWTPIGFRFALDLAPDARVLSMTIVVVLSAGVLFGFAPAWHASLPRPAAVLRSRADGPRASRLRRAFVATQVALSFVLLVVTALFGRAIAIAATHDSGMDTANVHLAVVAFGTAGVDEGRAAQAGRALLDAVATLPGITAAALTDRTPLALSGARAQVTRPDAPPGPPMRVETATISPGMLRLLGTDVLAGRDFIAAEPAGADVVLVDSAIARRLWPADDPVGRALIVDDSEVVVVGVVTAAPTRPGQAATAFLYRPWTSGSSAVLVVRSARDAEDVAALVRDMVSRVTPGATVRNQRTLAQFIGVTQLPQRIAGAVAGVLGAIGLLLCAVGLYAVVVVAVGQRRHELAIRMAMGAAPGAISRLVLGAGARTAGVGIILGLLASAALAPALRSLLFGLPPHDPVTFAGVTALLCAVVLAASAGPAWRAARGDPARALRSE
jgi:predicted permease